MEKKEYHGSGFVWGLLIGAALGGLVSTKKGRKIIKEVSEHGLEAIGNIVNVEEIEKAVREDWGVEEKVEVEVDKKTNGETPTPKKRRLFRGLKKKS